jgi:radical SAM enzyme (TIGR01210 family)
MYPVSGVDRDVFVLGHRGPRPPHNSWRYQNLAVEAERAADGHLAPTATVFLTGRECPWRCTMCDLWQYTTHTDTPAGAIPAQVAAARRALGSQPARPEQMKLYNAGSFFDPRAVPEQDYGAVAAHLAGLSRVIVESHPALVGPRVDRFLDALEGRRTASDRPPALEVAMGLETAHPEALEHLHKRMTVDDFAHAAEALKRRDVSLRVFLLISPPFVPADEQDAWLLRSVETAFACGATVVSLVPTRPGNGALDALATAGAFRAPRLEDIERSLESALTRAAGRGRVFVDLWDLERFARCPHCIASRRARLHAMNLGQRHLPAPSCPHCDGHTRR